MYCPNCGTKNTDDAKFCDNCGHPLGAAAQQNQPAAPPQQAAPIQPVNQQVQQAPPPQQAPQPPYQQPAPAPASGPGNGMAIASLTLGIVAAVFILIPGLAWIGTISAIVGLILGITARKKAPSGMATAGLILSIIALAISVVVVVACMACWGSLARFGSSFDW